MDEGIHLFKPFSVSEIKFMKRMQMHIDHIHLHEDADLVKHALELIPVEELNINATLHLSVLEEEGVGKSSISLLECLLKELMDWFKNSFFSWTDSPQCKKCGRSGDPKGNVPPNNTEARWLCHYVEVFFCTNCREDLRFPRYNHPKKLLETRHGRCGEWAKCFALLCQAMEFDVRIVYDWADHLWVEVWLENRNKWVHCDPCENVYDRPLLYEVGWKKNLSYVLAFGFNDVQDVTWRYTADFSKVLQRRKFIREELLVQVILAFRNKLQERYVAEKKKELALKTILELTELLAPPKTISEELQGRTSGSLAWRLARAETQMTTSSYVFTLNDAEIRDKYFQVRYSCSTDQYIRGADVCRKWETFASQYRNILRKVETDWKQAYLCRIEGADVGTLSWKFDFSLSGLRVQRVNLVLFGKTFESGHVKWCIYREDDLTIPKLCDEGDAWSLPTDTLIGCTGFTISAQLLGGTFQHAQIFRQSLDSTFFPFQVEIFFA